MHPLHNMYWNFIIEIIHLVSISVFIRSVFFKHVLVNNHSLYVLKSHITNCCYLKSIIFVFINVYIHLPLLGSLNLSFYKVVSCVYIFVHLLINNYSLYVLKTHQYSVLSLKLDYFQFINKKKSKCQFCSIRACKYMYVFVCVYKILHISIVFTSCACDLLRKDFVLPPTYKTESWFNEF